MALSRSPTPTPADPAALPGPTQRADGWTPERRATFLEALAEGHTVEAACRHVGLSVASAYALRRRAGGEAFALGWRAACLLARDRLADILASRAIDGQIETYTRADGTEVTRHRYDNRLAMSLLTRLDRLAERPAEPPARAVRSEVGDVDPQPTSAPDEAEAARLAAEAFPRLIAELIEGDGDAALTDDFVRTEAELRNPQLPQLRRYPKGKEWLAEFEDDPEVLADEEVLPFWYDEEVEQWLTSHPPALHFAGTEYGRYGERTYARTLTAEERAAVTDPIDARAAAHHDRLARADALEEHAEQEAIAARPKPARRPAAVHL